jgi:hypothetical protein
MTMLRTTLGVAAALALVAASPDALAQCYVDSQNGNDSNDGLSEATPVQSQSAIPSDCTEVRYARGSVFNEAVDIGGSFGGGGRTVFTSYGDPNLPKPAFIVPHTTNSGPLVSAYSGGITIDGLYLEGSKGDGTMGGLGQGVCVTIGGGSQVLNCEITNCDIGMMLHGEGSLIQGNYFHDMTMAVDAAQGSVDPNSVGGGNGIFIHGSNNEIAYNSFVRCADYAEWTQSPCDGGATEITVGSGATVTGVRVHHNYSYESCGFLEIATVAGEIGRFENSEFSYNVHIDGGWMMLLQVNNTEMSNVRFENNTLVQHPDTYNTGMVVTVFDGYSSGTSGGTLDPGEVSMTNNLIILDGVSSFGDVIDPAIAQATNLIINTSDQDPGVVNVAGTAAEDFDLVEGSPAIDQGTTVAGNTLDFLNRVVPAGGATDIGAFEYGAEESDGTEPVVPDPVDPTGGAGGGTGGTTTTETGGTTSTDPGPSTGGTTSTDPGPSTGGTTGTDPGPSTGGTTSTDPGPTTGGTTSTDPNPAAGGTPAAQASGGTVSSGGDTADVTGGTSADGDSTVARADGEPESSAQVMEATDEGGCACESVGARRTSNRGGPVGSSAALLLLAAAAVLRRRRQL